MTAVVLAAALWLVAGLGAEPASDAGTARGAHPTGPSRVRHLLEQQLVDDAVAEARRLATVDPDDPEVSSALGEALFRSGALGEAEAVLAGRDDLTGRGLVTLGRLRDARGRTGEAIALMDLALAASPDDPEVVYRSASATATRGEAVRRLEAYVEIAGDADDPDRVEAARGAARVLGALGERAVWVTRSRPERVELPLRRLWNPGTGSTIGFVVEAEIGTKRKPVRLLLDTGSPGLFVIERMARKRGFEPLATKNSYGGGGDRRHETTRGIFPSVRIGGLEFADALATTSEGEAELTGRYHGYLGIGAFTGYRVVIDLVADRLILEAPGTTAGAPYWDVEGQLLVTAGGDGGDHEGLFLLDTGATGTIVAESFASKHPAARAGVDADVRGFGGRIAGVRTLHGLEISFETATVGGELRLSDFSLRSRLTGVEIAGYLGLDMLDRSRIVIDTVARTVAIRKPDAARGKSGR